MLEDASSGFWLFVWEFLLLYYFFFVLRLIAILCACDRFILAAEIVPIGACAPIKVEIGCADMFAGVVGGFCLRVCVFFW